MSTTDKPIRAGFAETLNDGHAPTLAPVAGGGPLPAAALTQGRSTVLPPVDEVPAEGGRYAPVRRLGAGGMGEVALVRDLDIGRTVALKRPLGKLDEESLHRFAREVRTVGKLEHPSIVPIHDVGIDENGRHYFVMKYVEGETLATVIERLAAGDPQYVAKYTYEYRTQIFTQLLYAVKYAHARGVLHRDIKPMNVMIGPYGEVMLMDWGIARELGDKDEGPPPTPSGPRALADQPPGSSFETAAGTLLGSPAYMSPEQARGDVDRLDERSDIYSLCVLFHELITLKHYLRDHESTPALIAELIGGSDPGFLELISANPEAPPELIHFLRLGMRRDPGQRYQNIDAMLDELARNRDRRVAVRCHLTFMKRLLGAADHAINHHPILATIGTSLIGVSLIYGLVVGAMAALHALH